MIHALNRELLFNEVFKDINNSDKRVWVFKGSAGSGKSVNVAQLLFLHLLDDKGANLLCVRKAEVTNRDSTFAEFVQIKNKLHLPDSVVKCTENPLRITFYNGNSILFRGANNEKEREKLKSIQVKHGKLTDIWVEEATEMTQEDIEILEDRLRGDLPKGLRYRLILTFNPVSAQHWIKKAYFDKKHDDVITHHSTYKDNAFIDEGYSKRMERRKVLDPLGYQVYGLGEWGEAKGLIFVQGANWFIGDDLVEGGKLGKTVHSNRLNDNTVMVSQKLEDYDDVAMGVDFGFNHAFAWCVFGMKDDNLFVIRELYEYEKTTAQMIELAKAKRFYNLKNRNVWCDSAEPDRIVEIQQAGYRLADGVKKEANSVNAQIDWLKAREIYVHHSCTNMIAELSQWKWKVDKNGNALDTPVSIFDDAIASMRYGIEDWRKGREFIIRSKDEAFNGKQEETEEENETKNIFKPKFL